jgi:hypothetical protein
MEGHCAWMQKFNMTMKLMEVGLLMVVDSIACHLLRRRDAGSGLTNVQDATLEYVVLLAICA